MAAIHNKRLLLLLPSDNMLYQTANNRGVILSQWPRPKFIMLKIQWVTPSRGTNTSNTN